MDPDWLDQAQRFLPAAELTILLDVAPRLSAERKTVGRDRYERDLALLDRVRESYLRQAEQPGWIRVDGERGKAEVSQEIAVLVGEKLEPS